MQENEKDQFIGNQNIRQSYSQGFQDQTSPDLIKWQLNSNPILQPLRLKLMGIERYKDNDGNWVEERVSRPIVNDLCIRDIMNCLDSKVNKETILGNITDIQIKMIMYSSMKSISAILFTKAHFYSFIEKKLTPAELGYIYNIVEDFVLIVLSKAKDGEFLKFLKETLERKESSSIMPEKKSGLFPNFRDIFSSKKE